MVGVYAGMITTEVIEHKAFRNGTYQTLVNDTVSHAASAVTVICPAIPFRIFRAIPIPAARLGVYGPGLRKSTSMMAADKAD